MRLMLEQRRRFTDSSSRTPDSSVRVSRVRSPALELQRTAGNQAVQSLLRPALLQPPLGIGRVNDPLEHEADEMAAQVGGRSASRELKDNSTQGSDLHQLHRASAGGSSSITKTMGITGAMGVPGAVGQALQSMPHPLDPATRAFFEPRFGHDFGNVRIRTGSEAAASARSMHANAYTFGSDIVFREGAYAPGTDQGRRLLAHELAHVVQQGRAGASAPAVQRQAETESQGQSQGGPQVAVNSNCGEADARAIAAALVRAEGMVNGALDWFRNPGPENDPVVNALLRVRFGSDSAATRSEVNSRLARVAGILVEAQKANVNLNCADAKDAVCTKNEYYAYVQQGQGWRINFCREFFKMNPQEQVWGVMHETCHLAGALGDSYIFIYDADTAACYGASAVASPLGNADSYVSFVWCLVNPGSKIREGITINVR
jgi:hypothetical protein